MKHNNMILKLLKQHWRNIAVLATPLILLPLPIVSGTVTARCAYVVLIMAVYWVLELIPMAVTALIPIVLFPLLGILGTSETSMMYMKKTCMLFIGGLIMAIAVEHSNLHRRIALKILLLVGSSPRFIMLGFMIATAFLSMWISNTATTAMMIPIIEAVLEDLDTAENADKKSSFKRRKMMMLAVAFAANVGGTGTLIGTGPNTVLYEYLTQPQYKGQPISFGTWMAFAIPELLVNLLIAWLWLQLLFLPLKWSAKDKQENKVSDKLENGTGKPSGVQNILMSKYKELGKMSFHEWAVLILFILLIILWFFRKPGFMKGWAELLGIDLDVVDIEDATPAILIGLFMFIIPANPSNPDSEALLTWQVVEKKLPWGILILIGGGFALAEGTKTSCLNAWLGSRLAQLGELHEVVLLLIILLIVSAVTQVASNTATASMLLPILMELSRVLEMNPLYLILTSTLTCSYAFMLPISTPPNAIAFAASGMTTLDMMKAGAGMNLITIGTTIACIYLYGDPMFQLSTFPEWANSTATNVTNPCDMY